MKKLFIGLATLLFLTGCGQSLQSLAEAVLYQYQGVNSSYPVPKTPPQGFGKVTFNYNDQSGKPVHIVAWTYQQPKGSNRTIVFCHGNGDNLQALWVSKFLSVMEEFGANFIVIDYPSYGRSTGAPNQYTLVTAADKAIEWARQTYPNNKIYVWGRSLGTGVATLAVGQEQNLVSKLALTSAWTNFMDVARSVTSLANDLPQSWVNNNNYNSAAVAPTIHIPVMMQHGNVDKTIPIRFGLALKADFTASPSVKFYTINGRGHNNIFQDATVWQQLNQFFQ